MKLLIFKKEELIQELELSTGQTYKAGRKEGNDILLEKLPGISRQHFEISENAGDWHVLCHSDMKPLQFQGETQKEFILQGEGDFFLPPYRFQFIGNEDNLSDSPMESSEPKAVHDEISQALMPLDEGSSEIEDFHGNEEKTAIQNFNGLPYVKIIGQNGKKSEYFRLEGNLWIVGGHEDASVFIREASAAPNHFEISKTDKGYFILDLGTPQGTELNGQKLIAKKVTRLQSGDIISVGSTSLQFELRDKAFKRKVSNIPLNMYKNPLVFFDQDVAMVSLDEPSEEQGQAEEVKLDSPPSKEEKKKRLMIAVAVFMVLAVGAKEFLMAPQSKPAQTQGADPFSQLSPAEQKIVKQTYKLANQLYLDKNYELSLVQLEKLHQIIPVFKKSREMEEYCINARDVQRQQALIEQQRREQEELQAKVNSFISQCENQYRRSHDVDGVKSCLVPASDLDPNNPRIAQLITEVTARQDEKIVREKMAREQAEKVARGRELFGRARALHKKNKIHKAIEAYENHIHSGLPDPKRLVKRSKRYLSSIETAIHQKKSIFMRDARTKYSGTELREAIKLARQAQRVDPYDPEISAFLYQTEKELRNKMKTIYMDSVIEERFGNTEASRGKWEEILKKDIEDGEYYRKAKRKMKFYGFEN